MKVKIQTPQGSGIIAVQTSPAAAAGAMPTAAPGANLAKIIVGWPHGSTAGLGGADWVAGCGVFRGESYRMGPHFKQAKQACAEAGVGNLCSPQNPFGVWQIPWEFTLPPLGPDPAATLARLSLTLPIAGRLFAYEICASYVPDEIAPLPPSTGCCDCTGPCADLIVRNWKSRQIKQTYPGLGRDTNIQIGTAAPVEYRDEDEFTTACKYTPDRLLAGQNFLPPWVPNVDLQNGNDELTWEILNVNPTLSIRVQTILHIAYGEFDMAKAIEEYCESQASCAPCAA